MENNCNIKPQTITLHIHSNLNMDPNDEYEDIGSIPNATQIIGTNHERLRSQNQNQNQNNENDLDLHASPTEDDLLPSSINDPTLSSPYELPSSFLSSSLYHSSTSSSSSARRKTNPSIPKLRSIWLNERYSPTLLQYESETLMECKSLLDESKIVLETFLTSPTTSSSSTLPSSSSSQFLREAAKIGKFHSEVKKILSPIYQMEIDRISYMYTDYHRTRLIKIEKYAIHLLTPQKKHLLSEPERKFALQFVQLMENHFQNTFLSSLPTMFRAVATASKRPATVSSPSSSTQEEEVVYLHDSTHAVDAPSNHAHIVFQSLADVSIALGIDSENWMEVKQGDIIIAPFNNVEHLLTDRKIQLI